jgi:hypothetical protein
MVGGFVINKNESIEHLFCEDIYIYIYIYMGVKLNKIKLDLISFSCLIHMLGLLKLFNNLVAS